MLELQQKCRRTEGSAAAPPLTTPQPQRREPVHPASPPAASALPARQRPAARCAAPATRARHRAREPPPPRALPWPRQSRRLSRRRGQREGRAGRAAAPPPPAAAPARRRSRPLLPVAGVALHWPPGGERLARPPARAGRGAACGAAGQPGGPKFVGSLCRRCCSRRRGAAACGSRPHCRTAPPAAPAGPVRDGASGPQRPPLLPGLCVLPRRYAQLRHVGAGSPPLRRPRRTMALAQLPPPGLRAPAGGPLGLGDIEDVNGCAWRGGLWIQRPACGFSAPWAAAAARSGSLAPVLPSHAAFSCLPAHPCPARQCPAGTRACAAPGTCT